MKRNKTVRPPRAPKAPRAKRARPGEGLPPGFPFPCDHPMVGTRVSGPDFAGRVLGCAVPPEGKRGRYLFVGGQSVTRTRVASAATANDRTRAELSARWGGQDYEPGTRPVRAPRSEPASAPSMPSGMIRGLLPAPAPSRAPVPGARPLPPMPRGLATMSPLGPAPFFRPALRRAEMAGPAWTPAWSMPVWSTLPVINRYELMDHYIASGMSVEQASAQFMVDVVFYPRVRLSTDLGWGQYTDLYGVTDDIMAGRRKGSGRSPLYPPGPMIPPPASLTNRQVIELGHRIMHYWQSDIPWVPVRVASNGSDVRLEVVLPDGKLFAERVAPDGTHTKGEPISGDDAWEWATVVDVRFIPSVPASGGFVRTGWQATQQEYVADGGYKSKHAQLKRAGEHERTVANALRRGKPVPASVLADYPGFVMAYGPGVSERFQPPPCPDDPDITVGHSAMEGTYISVHGSTRKWNEAIKALHSGFKWWDEGGYWYRTQSKGAVKPTVNLGWIANQLTSAGAKVCLEGVTEVSEEEARDIKREHLENRSLRYWERSQKWSREASAQRARSDRAVEGIPMGQPILVGHHSEKRHRGALERSRNAMTASVEASNKAGYNASKSDALDRAAAALRPEAIAEQESGRSRVQTLSELISKRFKRDTGATMVRKTAASTGAREWAIFLVRFPAGSKPDSIDLHVDDGGLSINSSRKIAWPERDTSEASAQALYETLLDIDKKVRTRQS